MSSYAVVHGSLTTRGGAERVAEELARAFDAPLYLGFCDDSLLTEDDIEYHSLFESRLANFFNRRGALRDLYHFWNWQYRPELKEYDVLLVSGNEASWYVPPEGQTLIRYVHHPPHTAYDYYHRRADSRLTRLYTLAVRSLIYHTLPFTDTYIANSEVVADRLNQYWGVETEVIHPPVDVDTFSPKPHAERDDYYLVLSRLVPRKRVGAAVSAFTDTLTDKTLIVAGEGSQRNALERQAGDNIQFEGFVSENRKRELLQNTRALLMPSVKEDFGIVPVEAMAAGTPVIGTNEGFTAHHISDGESGILYERENLMTAITTFEKEGVSLTAEEISDSVHHFRPERFYEEIQEVVETTTQN